VRIEHGLEALGEPLERSVLTIGNFDGVHLAHQQLLIEARKWAVESGAPVVVLTFEPHPLTVVAPQRAPKRLTTPSDKLDLLQRFGADKVVVAKSEPSLLNLAAEEFVQEVVLTRFRPVHIVEGPSFGFGRGRKGTPELLKTLCEGPGCAVHIVEPVRVSVHGETVMVSSSLVRRYLEQGAVQEAATCLGRSYSISGPVIEGDRRGRAIGFPTINLNAGDVQLPGPGVYAGSAEIGNAHYLAAINVGSAPTFDQQEHRMEAHLLDFSGDLYGMTVRLVFERFLRGQHSFATPQALAEQLARDVQAVRQGVQLSTTVPNADRARCRP